jgi:4-hydroxybenzoate polyprenyltransferase
MLMIVFAAIGARVFGMAMNRIFDRHIDRLNPRTVERELPSGKMKLSTAMMVAGSGLSLYVLACWGLGGWCLALSPIPLIPLMGYSLLKRFTPLCHFGIGLCLALAPLGAYVAAAGHPRFPAPVILFSWFVFFWLSGADIIYALMDVESDRKNNIHSLPAAIGGQAAIKVAASIHIASWTLLAVVVMILDGGRMAWLALCITALFLGLMYLPSIPIGKRFFPISTIAGIAGAIAPIVT